MQSNRKGVGQIKEKVPEVNSFSSSLALKAASFWEGRAAILKYKTFTDFDPFVDSGLFSTGVNLADLSTEQMKVMEEELVKKFLEITNIAHSQNADDPSLWKSYKKKGGVDVYKRIASNTVGMIEMSKARISIQCDYAKLFSVRY
jgi:hypothetical protein